MSKIGRHKRAKDKKQRNRLRKVIKRSDSIVGQVFRKTAKLMKWKS